jgi:CheY-like chemotaxis protein
MQMNKPNIMLVEDEFIIATDIKERLENLGYSVCALLDTGEAALEKAQTLLPDLVLMDIFLKGQMDGIEAAMVLNENAKLPIIFLTAYASEDIIERAKLTEPMGYIIKPFKDRELRAAIEIALYKIVRGKESGNEIFDWELSDPSKQQIPSLIHICAYCKNVRDKDGNWIQLERFVGEQTGVQFSHSICAECAKKLPE